MARTQAERSAAMQAALIDAATELLIERGWAATTAVAVCERAGCTRGALIHHYPSMSALLADAIEAWFAAGNDPDLARELQPAMLRFAKLVSPDSAAANSPLRGADAKAFFL